MVLQMSGRVSDDFDSSVTHLVTHEARGNKYTVDSEFFMTILIIYLSCGDTWPAQSASVETAMDFRLL